MDFSEADRRFLELRELLSSKKINPGEYEKGAAQLRVLDEHGVWWAIHPRNGKWLRWDGKAWQLAKPPHHGTEEVKLPETPEAPQEPKATTVLEEKPPVGVVLKGEDALRQLLEVHRVCEEIGPEGPRLVPVDLMPGGMLRGIAYKLMEDGSLDPKVAILYATADTSNGKKMYVGGHWVIMPAQQGTDQPHEGPTERQVFTSLIREMIDNLEIGYELREKIKANLDLDQISLVDSVNLPEIPNRWWQVQIPPVTTPGAEFLGGVEKLCETISGEKKTIPRRRFLEQMEYQCERGLQRIDESQERELIAAIHTALAAVQVELACMEAEEMKRVCGFHLAEDHAELVEWYTQEGASTLATVGTLNWLLETRKKAAQVLTGVQADALRRRMERTEQNLEQLCESYLAKKKQVMRDLFTAKALEGGSQLVQNLEERQKVLSVALWQAQAADQLAQKIGETGLRRQCQDAILRIEEELAPLRGEYA
jgi:hypothetical protein